VTLKKIKSRSCGLWILLSKFTLWPNTDKKMWNCHNGHSNTTNQSSKHPFHVQVNIACFGPIGQAKAMWRRFLSADTFRIWLFKFWNSVKFTIISSHTLLMRILQLLSPLPLQSEQGMMIQTARFVYLVSFCMETGILVAHYRGFMMFHFQGRRWGFTFEIQFAGIFFHIKYWRLTVRFRF